MAAKMIVINCWLICQIKGSRILRTAGENFSKILVSSSRKFRVLNFLENHSEFKLKKQLPTSGRLFDRFSTSSTYWTSTDAQAIYGFIRNFRLFFIKFLAISRSGDQL